MNANQTITEIRADIQGKSLLIDDVDSGRAYLAEIVLVDRTTDPRLVMATLVHPEIHNGMKFQMLIAPSQAI